jgi:uncharacterized repeat protein (TIGR03803 family)
MRIVTRGMAIAVAALSLTGSALGAPVETVLASFNTSNGAYPYAGLIIDAAGDLFGTTSRGGANGYGTVFEIARTSAGYSAPITLASFNNTNGAYPFAGLISDAAGNLFGTTSGGGAGGYGTVFEIAKTSTGYNSTPTTLWSFNYTNGGNPYGLISDAAGDLFGTTQEGGPNDWGTVFEIAKTSTGYSTLTTLASFNLTNGGNPHGLISDAAGDLFGTTQSGGANGYGTVFEIAKTGTGYSAPITLASFNNTNGNGPSAGLTSDAAGDLFGTTVGGGANGYGTVFEIAKTSAGYSSTLTTLASFSGANGDGPLAGLIIDAAGDLFGTTEKGGAYIAGSSSGIGYGTVFEIAKTSTGYNSTPTTLWSFNGANGAYPFGGLISDAAGNLFGTTSGTGNGGDVYGTVFELTGTGFVPATPFAAFSGQLGIQFGKKPNTGAFELLSEFTLGQSSKGINPPAEPVTLTVGKFATTIPSGSFQGTGHGPFYFVGTINGVELELGIVPTGAKRYAFAAAAQNANLTGTTNPVPVSLTISYDTGTVSINAQIWPVGTSHYER